ncbi:UDP-N-acetylmuramate dehydrogenase [Algoriphagus kandeliae]|uniref:UDP-N-acetylenolpyruvoylglucosamine reductase n=1 Tax=Algoriphagus kandeliae TaxID=2562278 RepID=A0A4Y9R033_9BACT|nr:UDP-N-acetylmuramate dehydrogenase [Algoriphagus kandeliae]TFV97780.1 UDP-N-acetylmuramate dehydrogenase [Algoriphagus kandeliae]
MNIQENISLKPYNSFGLDKKARFFTAVESIDDLREALEFANRKKISVIILGGGSNILLTKDLEALVIKIDLKGIHVLEENDESLLVEVGAGEVWHEWVQYAIKNNWAGLENLSLIPGTVGASPMQNIGAYGVEVQDVFHSLKAFNRNTLSVEIFTAEQCEFGYRESVFKHKLKDQYVICSVTFKLSKEPIFQTEYGAIRETLKEMNVTETTIQAISEAVVKIRQSKLPDPKVIGNAGSFFKNPTVDFEVYEEIKKSYPSVPGYPQEQGIKIPAGWLIEQAGWKGFKKGQIGVHDKQALVLVNFGEGDGKEIAQLASEIQKSVQEKFGIQLTPEVNFL